jgi:hypothetical protein
MRRNLDPRPGCELVRSGLSWSRRVSSGTVDGDCGLVAMSHPTSASYLDRRYEKNPHIVSRLIGEEFILVPVRHDVADLESIYTLTGTGVRIWELLDERLTGHELKERIVEEFDVGHAEAEEDLVQFLRQLEEINGLLVIDDD